MAGRSPLWSRSLAMYSTMGVLPLPPTLRLPTLTTGRESRRRRAGWRPYHWRRQVVAAPYIVLSA
jgi:hypothetical protein